MASCFRSIKSGDQAFMGYGDVDLVGVLPCRCPGDVAVARARVLVERKDAEVIHFVTCAFTDKVKKGVYEIKEGSGFCSDLDGIMREVHERVKVRVVKGTSHLPAGYEVEIFD